MNYYERIQTSIDYIEDNMESKVDIKAAAQMAYMSLSSYYRLFFAIVGYTVKEYIRYRRISLAAEDLRDSNMRIIDIAIKYDFNSADAFSRAFKRITGYLPSQFKVGNGTYYFEKRDIMDRYFEVQDKALLEKYPDIKVLKELEPMRVAYYCYHGENPENHAFSVIREWLSTIDNGIEESTRIFGYNNPSPENMDQKEYGYEVCVTIDENFEVTDDRIKTKTLSGGLYAITSVRPSKATELGEEIVYAWKRFSSWLKESKYTLGGHQWLEEHIGFDSDYNHIGGIDIYMPIWEANSNDIDKSFKQVEPMYTASYTAHGPNAIGDGRKYFFKWLEENNLWNEDNKPRVFAYYNHERIGKKDFFYKISLVVDKDFEVRDKNISLDEFSGGYYAYMTTTYNRVGWAWEEFIKWVSESRDYCFGNYWFFEEYLLEKPSITPTTEIVLNMPVQKKG